MTVDAKTDWQYKLIDDITKGVNVSIRPDALKDGELTDALNVFFFKKQLQSDTGYVKFASAVKGTPRATFQFFKKSGTSALLLFTNSNIYKLVLSQWQFVSSGTDTTLTANAATSATTITVASTAGFADGDDIGITLDDGTEHQSTIAAGGIIGSTITITSGLPSPAASGNAVTQAATLAGTDDEQISFAPFPAFDWLVFTNGIDVPKYYDGTKITDIPGLPSSGNVIAKSIAVFNNYLMLFNTTEGGTAFPQRVRWSDTADPTNWTTGNAGFLDLYDNEDFVITTLPLGPYLILYREREIVRIEYVGSSTKLFNFDTMVAGEGIKSIDAVADVGGFHLLVGNANVYKYRGDFELAPVSDTIYNKLFGVAGEINPPYAHRISSFYVEELDEYWILYPDVNGTYPNQLARYNISDDSWSFRDFGIDLTGFGFYQLDSTQTWLDLVGDWTEQTWLWGGSRTQANAPITQLCSNSGSVNYVYSYDYLNPDDDGSTISWHFQTKDFFNPTNKLRFDFIEFAATGGSVTVNYSTDGGVSWNPMEVVTLMTDLEKYRVYKQFVAERARFKFSGTGSGFAMEYLGIRFRNESIH